MASQEKGAESRHSLTGQDSETAVQRHHRKGNRRSLIHTNIAESMKIKQALEFFCIFTETLLLPLISQARTKALREQQRSRLDGRHKYIVSLVAMQVELTDAEVEDNLLDGNQVLFYVLCVVSSFFWSYISDSCLSWTILMSFLLLMADHVSCSTTRRQRSQLPVNFPHIIAWQHNIIL